MQKVIVALAIGLICAASAKVYLHENFDGDALSRWVQSDKKSDYGKFELSSGAFFGNEKINRGLKTSQDAHFYAASTKIEGDGVTNKGKDFVASISVKHEQGIDCGGGYVKIAPAMEPKDFHGETEYWMMFGPDVCGYNRKIHLIFNYGGTNLLWKKEPRFPDDKFTHVYTVRVTSDNKYEVFVDQELKESGKLEEDWAFLKPKEIDDPTDKKPEDWVDEAQIDDPEDKKPEDWDVEPATIADPDAKQPEDWDAEEDGQWEAPQIPNPKHKGEWRPKRIPNPGYKGVWHPKRIPNPDYKEDADLYLIPKPLKHVGIDIWQVKSGTIFDNIIIADNLEEVNAIVDKTWKATKDAEKAASEKNDEKADAKSDEEDKEDL